MSTAKRFFMYCLIKLFCLYTGRVFLIVGGIMVSTIAVYYLLTHLLLIGLILPTLTVLLLAGIMYLIDKWVG